MPEVRFSVNYDPQGELNHKAFDALVRGWKSDANARTEEEKKRRQAVAAAFGQEWLDMYDKSSDYSKADACGMRYLRTFFFEQTSERKGTYDDCGALYDYYHKQAGDSPDIKDFATMWEHYKRTRGEQLEREEKRKEKWNSAVEYVEKAVGGAQGRVGWGELTQKVVSMVDEDDRWQVALVMGDMKKTDDEAFGRYEGFWKALAEKNARPQDMKWSVWNRQQVTDLAKELAALKKNDPDTYRYVMRDFRRAAKQNTGNAGEDYYAGLPAQVGINLLDILASAGGMMAEERDFTKNDAATLYTDGPYRAYTSFYARHNPFSDGEYKAPALSKEERAERNEIMQVLRDMRGGHGDEAWDMTLGGESVRDVFAKGVASTVDFALTRGMGTFSDVTSTQREKLLGEGSGELSALLRGATQGAIETATEYAFGLGGRVLGVRKAAGDFLLSKAPVRRAFGSLIEGGNRLAGYMGGFTTALANKQYGSAALRGLTEVGTGTVGEMMEEVIGTAVGVPADAWLARVFGEKNYDAYGKGVWNTVLEQEKKLLGNPSLWVSFALMSGAVAGRNLGQYKRDAVLSTADVRMLEGIGIAQEEAKRIVNIAKPQERIEAVRQAARDAFAKNDDAQAEAAMSPRKRTEIFRSISEDMQPLMEYAAFDAYYNSGLLPQVSEAVNPDGTRKTDGKGEALWTVQQRQDDGSVDSFELNEQQATAYVQGKLSRLVQQEQAKIASYMLGRAMVSELSKSQNAVTEEAGETMNAEYFRRLATAAQVVLDEGASADDVVPGLHRSLTLGQLVRQGEAWEQRMAVARSEYENSVGHAVSDAAWEEKAKRLYSPVNRTRLRNRVQTLFRFARGEAHAENVLEDVVEDSLAREMERTGRGVGWYAGNMLELERALGREGEFLRKLGEGEQYNNMDIVEGIGKLVRSKVLADTARENNELPDWVNAFLDMLRRWVEQAKALMDLGVAVNRVLNDAEAAKKYDADFVDMVNKLVQQNTDFLKRLQRESGLQYTYRAVEAAVDAAAAPVMEELGLTPQVPESTTPIMDEAAEQHGEAVELENADKERRQEEVTRDILDAAPGVEDVPVTPSPGKKAEPRPKSKKKEKGARTMEDLTREKDLQAFGKAERKSGRTAEQAHYAVMAAAWLKYNGGKLTTANKRKARRMGEYVVWKLAAIEKESRFFNGNDFVSENTLEGYAMVWHEEAAMWKSFVAYPAAVKEAAEWDGRRKVKAENREAEANRRAAEEATGSLFGGSFSVTVPRKRICRTRKEARAMVGRKGGPLHLENRFLELEAVFNSKSDGKFNDGDSIGRSIAMLTADGLSEDEARTAHYTAYGNVTELFANGERMSFERAYKKKDVRKGFLHVYSPFEIEGGKEQYEANIELELHQEAGHLPTAYLLNVYIQKRKPAIESGGDFSVPHAVPASSFRGIKTDFPDIVKNYPHSRERIVPADAKSATDNRGTFDGENPDISFSVSPTLREDLAAAYEHRLKASAIIPLCTAPRAFAALGLPMLDIVTTPKIIGKVKNKHQMNLDAVEKAVRGMDDPLLIIRENDGRLILYPGGMAWSKNGEGDVVAPIRLELSQDKSHFMTTMYGLDNLQKTEEHLKIGHLLYSKYEKAELAASNAPGLSPDLVRLVTEHGFTGDTITAMDIVKSGGEDFSASLRFLPEATVLHDGLTAPVSVRGYAAFVQQIERDMEEALGRFHTMGAKAVSRREKDLVAVGTAYNLAKATAAYLPKGYRFSIRPYLNRLQVFAELAASGDLDFTEDLASQKVRNLDELEGAAHDLRGTIDGMVEEYGNKKVNEILSSLLDKTTSNLRRWAKDQVEKDILALLDRVRPKKDKTGKLKGVMGAESYREMARVEAALDLSAEELEDKLNALEGQIGAEQGKADSGNKLLELEAEYNLLSTFGNWRDMSLEQAVEAYENLQQRISMNKWAWQNVLADRRLTQAAVVNEVVKKLGRPGINKAHRAKMDAPAMKRLKSVSNVLQSFPQVITALRGLGLGRLATGLENRLNSALESMKTAERERWKDIEALSRLCFKKGWASMMNEMHELRDTGVPFSKPEVRRVKVRTDYAGKLVNMTSEEREQVRKEANEAGGVAALSTYSERAVEEMRRQLEAGAGTGMRGKMRKWLEFKYVESYRREESLELSKGQALYVILMYEQPTYTERMERQGYTPEVIEGLRRFVGDEMVEFGYGLRELFARQGDKLAAVYEQQYGVPFPREKNYFAAKFEVPESGDEMVRMLTSFSGQPGASTGFLKQRVKDHNLDLDTTKDALQVFLQGTTLSDTWLATQDIVRDLRAYMRDTAFNESMLAAMGKDEYDNFRAWVQLLEQGGVRETVNMGAAQTWVDRIYGSTSIATLGLRIQTLFRQIPAVFNGLLGAYDIGIKEWLVTLARMKRGELPMNFSRMLNSEFMKNRQSGDVGSMKSQAMRESGELVSPLEKALEYAMKPMEWTDARLTAAGLVPVWNVYYQRALKNGSSTAEAEQYAWQRTVECANRASQPVGWVNKSKLGNDRSLSARALTFMLSEDLNKMGLCIGLWKSGHKGSAVRAWLVYGAANATVSLLLDLLTKGFDKEEEDADWWADVAGFLMATLYGPAASCPGISEFVEWLGTTILQGVGKLTGSEELQKAKARASVGRALIDFGGMYKSATKMYDMFTDDKEYGWSEYTKTAMRASKAVSVLAGSTGTSVGYACLFLQTLLNPVDFAAKIGDAWFAGEEE